MYRNRESSRFLSFASHPRLNRGQAGCSPYQFGNFREQRKMRAGKMHKLTQQAISIQNNWLEDVLAGLLINGVSCDRIRVEHNSNSIKVYVDGIIKYSFQFVMCPQFSPRWDRATCQMVKACYML